MMHKLLKLSLLSLVACQNGAYSREEPSSSSLRGSLQILQFDEYIAKKQNSCASKPNPMNCIDCVGPNGIGTKRTHAEACDDTAAQGFSVPYSCEEGQKLCCSVSSITETNFGNPSKYGTCEKVSGSGRGNTRNNGRSACAKDGSMVRMNLYKNPPYSDEQNPITDLNDLCCSGQVGGVTCVSGTGIDEKGRQWVDGSCDGECGAESGPVKWKTLKA